MSWQEAFLDQAEHCADLGSPFTARLMNLAAQNLDGSCAVGERLIQWPGDSSHRADAVPLRFAGALHALARAGSSYLQGVYPPRDLSVDDVQLWSAVRIVIQRESVFIIDWLESAPQTNEVHRSAALLPGFLTIAERTGLDLVTSELGASAGLNMRWDQFYYDIGERNFGDATSGLRLNPSWRGAAPPAGTCRVQARAGCDLAPLDPSSSACEERLLSYVWADQFDRMQRTTAALKIAAADGIRVQESDALPWLRARLKKVYSGAVHVVYHSIAWQYFPEQVKLAISAAMEEAGARASQKAPLAWLQMESDGQDPGAAIRLRLWPGPGERLIGRADYHGRWIDWKGWG